MEEGRLRRPIVTILCIYLICFALRAVEYLLIRTDQSVFGEAFLHKLAGLGVLVLAMKRFSLKRDEVGFAARKADALRFAAYGLLLGISVFCVAYGAEYLIQRAAGNAPSLRLYVTSYAIDGNIGNQTGLLFFAICVVGNIINVAMEEGVFRGLFVRLAQEKHSFFAALVLSSALFGLWHIAAPVRSWIDGNMSATGAILYALMLIGTTGIVGAKFCLLTKMTGSLWMAMADHFVNNAVVNVLHVVTASGADELQVVRISIAQTVSFLIVLALYLKTGAGRKPTFRIEA